MVDEWKSNRGEKIAAYDEETKMALSDVMMSLRTPINIAILAR